jgi:calreticulin
MQKPDDWDEEEDGEWVAPQIDNPAYKGEWKPKMIPNPAYKGPWIHPEIDNPEYKEDNELYHICKSCGGVGLEIWQVKSGTIFDDFIVTDSIEEANAFAKETFEAKKDAEKKAFDALEDAKKAEEERTRKAEEEKRKAAEADKEEDEDEDEDKDEL